jgi:hypothetical protein
LFLYHEGQVLPVLIAINLDINLLLDIQLPNWVGFFSKSFCTYRKVKTCMAFPILFIYSLSNPANVYSLLAPALKQAHFNNSLTYVFLFNLSIPNKTTKVFHNWIQFAGGLFVYICLENKHQLKLRKQFYLIVDANLCGLIV